MGMTAVNIEGDGPSILPDLEEAERKLGAGEADIVLDFASVRRMDANALRAIRHLADAAEGKAVKIVLRGMSVEVYRVLKLLELTPRFSFSD